MRTILHPRKCDCGKDLTQLHSVKVHCSLVGGHEFDVYSSVDEETMELNDSQGYVRDGHHAGSFCQGCDGLIEELEPDAQMEPDESDYGPVEPRRHITWRDVLTMLLNAENCELDQDMTVYDGGGDEFYAVTGLGVAKDVEENPAAGVLDDGHLYFEFSII